MRKLKLLFAACALFVGGMTASAQDAGTYYIQNVSNGKWLGPGNNWSTQASVLNHADYWKMAKINDGVYTLESVVSNGGTNYYLTGTYCDGGATNFTFNAVAGKANTYTIANDKGGLLTTNGTTVDVSGTDASAAASQWKLWSESDMDAGMAAATVTSPFDATYLIKDHDLGRNNRDYSAWSNTGATAPKTSMSTENGTSVYSIEAYCKTFDVNQTLSGVPNGVYAVRVNGFYRQDGSNADLPYVYANNSKTTLPVRTGTENNMQDAAVSFVAGNYLSEPAYVQVTDNTLKIGVATEGNSCWSIFKNFHLAYYGDCTVAEVVLADYVKAYNEALAEAQAFTETSMFAEAWSELQSKISSNTLDLNNVTQDQLETATASLKTANAAANAAVKAKTVYDSAVALINGGTNVDLTSVVVNPSFEEGNLNGWTSVNGGAPANNNNWSKVGTWYVERWAWYSDTQTHLSDGTLTHDALVLPAGLYTITAKAQNQEQKNGKAGNGYFLYANDEKVEITGTNTYSTSVLLSTDKSELVIKFALEGCTGNWISCDDIHLTYVGSDFPAYTLVTGKMNADVAATQTAADEAFKANKTVANYNALTAAIANAQASKDAYAAAATAIANANELKDAHNLASTTAYNTFAEAIAALETKYNNNTMTTDEGNGAGLALGTVITGWHAGANSAAVAYLNDGFSLNAFDAALYINTWSEEGESDGSNFKVPFYEYFAGDGSALGENTWTGQVTGLENGLYSVSAWVRVRAMNDQTAVADLTGITMNVNGGTAVDVTEGEQVGESRFQHEVYTAEGLVKDGVLQVNFDIASENNIHWLSFKNIKYTKVRDLTEEEKIVVATVGDLDALNSAINTAEAKKLGFQQGEYAPYNNVEALAALIAAKSIDQEYEYLPQADVQNATTALNNATWTQNTEEMNAVYDGTFAAAENNGAPAGWTMSNNTLGGEYHARAFVGENRLSEFNETNSGLFLRFDGTNSNRGSMYYYGNIEGYTMPLAEGVTYRLTVDAKNWGTATNKPLRLNVTGPEGFTAVSQTINMTNDADKDNVDPQQFNIVFKATVAGNYVINFQCPGSDDNKHNVIVSNIVLKSAAPVEVSVSEAGYATFVSDVDLDYTNVDGLTAYRATVSGNEAVFEKVTEVPAGEGVLLKGEGKFNVPVTAGLTAWAEDYNAFVRGTGAAVVSNEGNIFNYVLSKHNDVVAFYLASGKVVETDKAYLSTTVEASRLGMRFSDQTTGISAIGMEQMGNDVIYNLNGQRVQNAQKGLFIQNGKKVIRK